MVGTDIPCVESGEYEVSVWCREALTDLRSLFGPSWPLESSEIAGLGANIGIGGYSMLHSLRSDFRDVSAARKDF